MSGCCVASLGRLSDPSLVRDRAKATFEDAVALVNPAGVNLYPLMNGMYEAGIAYYYELSAKVDDKPCREKFPDGCPFLSPFCHEPSGECKPPVCDDFVYLCNSPNEAGRLARALCPDTCGCEFPFDLYSQTALTDPKDRCSVDAAPMHINSLRTIPCKDVSPELEGDDYDAALSQYSPVGNITRWSAFKNFLDLWEEANEGAPLEMKKETASDIKYLREYGCDYLKNLSLWDSLVSYEAWKADARSNNSTVKTPYWLGRNLCVRGRGHQPLSLFCPEACGCHRGDEDCPLTCPERDETTPTCPAHQARIFVMRDKDAISDGYYCPRRPLTHTVDVGNKGMSAEEIRTILSPPPPPENCAAASTGACLENDRVDPDCCAQCGEGSCAPGYTYAGQFVFEDKETLSSTYPDFLSLCGEIYCGNTCCVPSDEWDGTRSAAVD